MAEGAGVAAAGVGTVGGGMPARVDAPDKAARIGPNAITQLARPLALRLSEAEIGALYTAAGVLPWRAAPPREMVDERPVAALHRALRQRHPEIAGAVAAEAGRLTGLYVLENRIPRPARVILKALPARLAGPLLVRAIARHAWTFAGSGRFRVAGRRPLVLEIADNPVVRGEAADAPLCAWHAAVFETLLSALVDPRARVREVACCATGAPACRFVVDAAPAR